MVSRETNTKTSWVRLRTPAVLVLMAALCGPLLWVMMSCGPGLYELPPPPPREDWRRHSLNPAEDDALSQEHFLAAQGSVIAFAEALSDERWDEAYRLLSYETRMLLDDLSPSGLGETVLQDGIIERNGSQFTVDPLDLFVIRGLEDLVDTWEDEMEAETYRRKELWAVSSDGVAHHIVLILEEDEWHLHKPEIDLTPGAPGRRTATE